MFFRTSTGGLVIIGAALPKNGYEYLEFQKNKILRVYRIYSLLKKRQYGKTWDFWPRWRHRWIYRASSHNQKKDSNKFKNKKNNQKCKKIKLYGSPTTKEVKKKYSFRLVGGTEMGSWGGEGRQQGGCGGPGNQGSGLWTGWPSICILINPEEQLGSETDHTAQSSSVGEKKSLKTSDCKILWRLWWWEKLPASQESSLERSTGS